MERVMCVRGFVKLVGAGALALLVSLTATSSAKANGNNMPNNTRRNNGVPVNSGNNNYRTELNRMTAWYNNSARMAIPANWGGPFNTNGYENYFAGRNGSNQPAMTSSAVPTNHSGNHNANGPAPIYYNHGIKPMVNGLARLTRPR